MKKILFFLLISQLVFSQQWSISFSERNALINLYSTTNGEQWSQKWDMNKDPKLWYGIKVKNGSVAEINLRGNGLQGNFPTFVSALPKLQKLDLSSNQLSGQLPQALSTIAATLLRLDISNNSFEGDPSNAIASLSNLQELSLGNNDFIFSDIDAFLQHFPQLKVLDLSHCALSAVPQKIATLSQLEALTLSNNSISQGFSNTASLSNLSYLNFSGNNLSTIPAAFSSLTQLTTLDLSFNALARNYATPLSTLQNLEWLSLASNQIATIPAEISQLKKLVHLNLADNKIAGGLENLVILKDLEQLYLDKNLLSGGFPSTLLQLKNLQMLSLTRNKLSGEIPQNLPALTFLENNRFTMQELKTFLAQDHKFSDFTYSPQLYDEEKSMSIHLGGSINLPQSLSGPNYQFTWFKNLDQKTSVTTENYHISSAEESDFGQYTCEAYYFEKLPNILLELSLYREPVTLTKDLATEEIKTTLAVYPNPTADYLHIRTTKIIEKVFVFDLSGKLLITEKSKTIDVRNLPSAAYVISVKTDDGLKSFKFIKK